MKSDLYVALVLSAYLFLFKCLATHGLLRRGNNSHHNISILGFVMDSSPLQAFIAITPILEISPSLFNDALSIKQPLKIKKRKLSMNFPSNQPTYQPRNKPSHQPMISPSIQPTSQPHKKPLRKPVNAPSNQPTYQPRNKPSLQPMRAPSNQPTYQPNGRPSRQPMNAPSRQPTNPTSHPSEQPTRQPSRQPTLSPNKPSCQPSGQPSRQPRLIPSSHPTSRPTSSPSSRPIAQAWFYTTFLNFKSVPYLVMFSITGFFFFLALLTFVSAGMNIDDGRNILFSLSIVNFFMWTTFHLVMLAARFDFWLNSGQVYQPYRIESNNVMIWVDPTTFFHVGKSTLKNYDCEYSTSHPVGYSAVVASDQCDFLDFSFSRSLITEGEVKFSIGCGLIMYIIYQFFILYMEILDDADEYAAPVNLDRAVNVMQHGPELDVQNQNPVFTMWITIRKSYFYKALVRYILTTLINCQQGLVLLPLTNMSTNQYCVQVVTPTSNEDAICLFKYAAYSLPYGIIYGLYTLVGIMVMCLFRIGNIPCLCQILLLFVAIGTSYCAFYSAAFLAFYFFGGIAIGLWFQFGVYYWALQTSRPEFLSISLFIFCEILWVIVPLIRGA